jgi:hypothetical protein
LRVRSVCLASALSLAALALPAAAHADTMIAAESAPSKISTDGARVVWSSFDPATGDYHLMSHDTQGATTALPVAPRKVPFDVDLGYLSEGAEVAVYSRCRREPALIGGTPEVLPLWASARGCDLYRFSFEDNRERKIAAVSTKRASEFLPTVSPARGPIAFARVYERRRGRRGRLPYLYVKRGSHSAQRLPGGPRGKSGLPGPTALDLNGRLLAFEWSWVPRFKGFRDSSVRLDAARGSRRELDSVVTGLTIRHLTSPTVIGKDVYWARVVTADTPATAASEFRRYSAASRKFAAAPAAHFIVSTSFAFDAAYYLTSEEAGGQATLQSSPCGGPPQTHLRLCELVRADPIAFAPIHR